MCSHDHQHGDFPQPRCCPALCTSGSSRGDITRRTFLGGLSGAAIGGMALSGLSWSALMAAEPAVDMPSPSRPLVVKPVFLYRVYQPRPQWSWRPWGGIVNEQDAQEESARIRSELDQMTQAADFSLKFLPLTATMNAAELAGMDDVKSADVLLVYAHDGDLNAIAALQKDTIFFVRHTSGPLYLNYEIISPRFLRQHTDALAVKSIDYEDVVVDKLDEVVWRLRALAGLQNTMGSKILCVGGPGAWAQPAGVVPDLVRAKWKLDLVTVEYDELGKLITAARQDSGTVNLARQRAAAYLALPDTKLETKKEFVENCFVLDQVFRRLLREADCRAITINGCMGTIIPLSETTACLTLTTLNDDGYLAFCESDFVVIPSGILLSNICGKPMFFHNPTYPHDGIITLAHCTAPRKMDGQTLEPVRLLTHLESDYGAAPKVEMRVGQQITSIIPDFQSQRWLGLLGEIVAHPFLPICRSQIEARYNVPSDVLAERMHGFHWMTVYGDYLREMGYALKRVPIEWERLG